jgi:hypothetical protein
MRSLACVVVGLIFVSSRSLAGDVSYDQPLSDTQGVDSTQDGTPSATGTTTQDGADAAAANDSTEDDALPGDTLHNPPMTFDGQKLNFASKAGNADGTAVIEYLPAGQNLEKWTKLAAVWTYAEINEPQRLADAILDDLNKKGPDAAAHKNNSQNPDEAVIDFLAWPDDKSYVEFNVWKFRKRDGGGVIGEQYAVRDYTDPKKFVSELGPQREKLVKEMINNGLQSDASGNPE